ncbi:hypothetical protein VP14_105 [Vibrio phage VPMCC14]|nr:hypothetical protein VP14_105 [Vibrio phage VPMCC14]
MINYCFDYVYQDGSYVDYGTVVESSEQDRSAAIKSLCDDGYKITIVYENEDCYCQARNYGECACGNFK